MAGFTKPTAERVLEATRFVENRFYPHDKRPAQRPGRSSRDGLIRIQNKTGEDRRRGDVVGVGDPAVDPETDTRGYLAEPWYKGETYNSGTHQGAFAILLDDCKNNRSIYAILIGTVQCRIQVTDSGARIAGPKDGEYKLFTGQSGASIQHKASGTGEKWALVTIGGGGAGTSLEHAILVGSVGPAVVTTSSADPGLSGTDEARLVAPDDDGVFVPVIVDGSPVRMKAAWRGAVTLTASSDQPLWVSGYRIALGGEEVFLVTSETDLRGVPGFNPTLPQAIRHLASDGNYAWGGQTCAEPAEE